MSEVFTVADLCERWKCCRRTVHEAIHSGELKAFRLGKRTYRVTLEAVREYEERKQAA